jgi:hypothetical protein
MFLIKKLEIFGGLAANSIKTTVSYLGIQTEIDSSSGVYSNQDLSGKERVVDICLKEKATTYINCAGWIQICTAKSISGLIRSNFNFYSLTQ